MGLFDQGCSPLATAKKQESVEGVTFMETLRLKNFNRDVLFADIFCGSGENIVNGETINGSPISMLDGFLSAVVAMKEPPKSNYRFVFSDVAEGRADSRLVANVRNWQERVGMEPDPFLFKAYTKGGHAVTAKLFYAQSWAEEAVEALKDKVIKNRNGFLVLFVDPNGPKAAPWKGMRELWDKAASRVRITVSISATTLKRIRAAKEVSQLNWAQVPDHISGMIEWFSGAGGWVRSPVNADQWTVVCLSKVPPRNGWNKGGFVLIDSNEGREMIKRLSLTKQELLQCSK